MCYNPYCILNHLNYDKISTLFYLKEYNNNKVNIIYLPINKKTAKKMH